MKTKSFLSPVVLSLCHFSNLAIADRAVPSDKQDEPFIATTELKPTSFFRHRSVIIPHDDKKHRGGEDAAATNDQWLVGESKSSR